MNKLVYSALAFCLASPLGNASENEWSSLDQEINSLSSSLVQDMGPTLGGWIIGRFDHSGDFETDANGDGDVNDLSGFSVDNARVWVRGDVGDYGYKIEGDFGDNQAAVSTFLVRDAYATWRMGDEIEGRVGNFRQPFLRSSLISENHTLFIDRSLLGETFEIYDVGLQLSGSFDTLGWWIAGQNGADSVEDEFLLTARVQVSLLGEGMTDVEGAYGASEDTNVIVGAAISDEGSVNDGRQIALDAALTAGPFSVAGEVADLDDDIAFLGTTGSTPWDITASYMIAPEEYEVAVRWEDFDDDNDTTALSLGLNKYVKGHDIKWQVNWQMFDSDLDILDGDVFSGALVVSF